MAEYYKNYTEIFPDAPVMTDEIRLALHRKFDKHYIFYRKHKNYADCYCTCCLERFQIRYTSTNSPKEVEEFEFLNTLEHNNHAQCPYCETEVTIKAESIGRKNLYQTNYVGHVFSSEDGATVWLLLGDIRGDFGDADYHTIECLKNEYGGPCWYPRFLLRLRRGEVRRAVRFYTKWYEDRSRYTEPVARKGIMYNPTQYFILDNPKVLEDTFLRYIVPYREYFSKDIRFLQYAAKYPTVEMLCKLGGLKILDDFIDRDHAYKRLINLSGRTPAEVFRTDGNTAARIKASLKTKQIGLDELESYKEIRKLGYSIDDAIDVCDVCDNYRSALSIMKRTGLSLRKLVNYIRKQADRGVPVRGIFGMYIDYLSECERLDYDVKESMINRPRDLIAAHDRTMSAIRAIELGKRARQYDSRLPEYRANVYPEYVNRYEYSKDGFSIIVPRDAREIITEGAEMRHCVAGYAEMHISGVLAILFLRKTDEPDKALYTIEMKEKRLVQVQGYNNRTPLTPEAQAFFDEWLKWQALPEAQKHPKRRKTKKSA